MVYILFMDYKFAIKTNAEMYNFFWKINKNLLSKYTVKTVILFYRIFWEMR